MFLDFKAFRNNIDIIFYIYFESQSVCKFYVNEKVGLNLWMLVSAMAEITEIRP